MKQILLIDDDAFFRAMFSGLLNWNELGYSLLQAENGQEAIGLLHSHRDISLVFTDMSMPVLDGVELIRYVSEHCPGIHCVALSAYDNFEYVKSSFKSGVEDYLLKQTLTKEQLLELLHKYAGNREPSASSGGVDMQQRAAFLSDFIMGAYASAEECAPLFSVLSLPVLTEHLTLCVLLADTKDGVIAFRGTPEAGESHLRTALSMLQSIIDRSGVGVAFRGAQDHLIYLAFTSPAFENQQFAWQAAQTLATQAEATLLRYFNLHVRGYCSPPCRELSSVRQAYQSMMRKAGRAIAVKEERPAIDIPPPGRGALRDALLFGTPEELRRLISGAYLSGRNLHGTTSDFMKLSARCLALLEQLAGELVPEARQPGDAGQRLADEANDERQEALVTACFVELQQAVAGKAKAQYSPVVYSCLCKIHQEYGDTRLSPATLSSALRVNPAYLSRLFKAQTGQSLVDYVSARRLTCACRSLQNGDLSVKEAAEQCGFDHYNYFFKVFKKRFGITPKEYQVRALSGQAEPDA